MLVYAPASARTSLDRDSPSLTDTTMAVTRLLREKKMHAAPDVAAKSIRGFDRDGTRVIA